ncbi:MAG: ABC transporter ATP-binding protein [Phycisphaerae bacterium]|jgi:ABC-2 type transport system ATP-binding protein
MENENTIVQVRDLSKKFGKILALDKIDLDISRGQIIGLLGANGAGKSTLLRHIIGLYLADEGQCKTFGTNAEKLSPIELGKIGYVHQEGELLGWMTAGQLIRYVSAYYKNWNHELEEKYIADFGISIKTKVGTLSPGQRQQLAILLAIGFEPELLILDEPASGLDPIARSQFLDLLLQIIQDEKHTIIISSHILSDVEKVIDHTLIMRQGKILRDCSFDRLQEEFLRFTITSLNGPLPANLPFENIISCQRDNDKAVITVQNNTEEQLRDAAKKLNSEIQVRMLTLEDLYKIVVNQK